MKNSFINVAATINNPKWNNIISRDSHLYSRNTDIRSEFERDYTRIIHSSAYRRLKHKTQVFFSPENDHICTRIEHVTHVESISYTISNYLGLNTELTRAISVAHDLGHSPFGHEGEHILSDLSKKDLGISFWHEKNGLELVDYIELLEDDNKYSRNLDLTYGVRDGIISHCGEIDENSIKPRDEFIDLSEYNYPNQFTPYTWEGCVVKVSDKIAYLGRDIEDAITLGILDEHLDELYTLLEYDSSNTKLNNTFIINYLVSDVCKNSSPEKGICFSDKAFALMNKIKDFNYKNIYLSDRIQPSRRFFNLVLSEIYTTLKSCFNGSSAFESIKSLQKFYPKLYSNFSEFLRDYYDWSNREQLRLKNKILFRNSSETDFYRAIIYFISGMTDNFAMETYNEIIRF